MLMDIADNHTTACAVSALLPRLRFLRQTGGSYLPSLAKVQGGFAVCWWLVSWLRRSPGAAQQLEQDSAGN
jgi:hypothetical protein